VIANRDISFRSGREIRRIDRPKRRRQVRTLFNLIACDAAATRGSIWFLTVEDSLRWPAAERCQPRIRAPSSRESIRGTMTVIDNVMRWRAGPHHRDARARRKAHQVLEFAGPRRARRRAFQRIDPLRKNAGSRLPRALADRPKAAACLTNGSRADPDRGAEPASELLRTCAPHGVTGACWLEHVMEIVMRLVRPRPACSISKVLVSGKPAAIVRDPKVSRPTLGIVSCCRCCQSTTAYHGLVAISAFTIRAPRARSWLVAAPMAPGNRH